MGKQLFVLPPLSAFKSADGLGYQGGFVSYSHYNYLRKGVISRLKRRRFEVALRLATSLSSRSVGAVDYGCADGILLPSLARYFGEVLAVDREPGFARTSEDLARALGLPNVSVVCNAGLSVTEVRARSLGKVPLRVGFLLEILEHVGRSPETMYDDKMQVVEDLFALLDNEGVAIISVPRMLGFAFVAKYLVQVAFRLHHERMSPWEVWQSLRRDVSSLEPRWNTGHLGFSEDKLAARLVGRFGQVDRVDLFETCFYVVRRSASAA